MNVVTLTDDNFETEVNASEKPVLVDYWATWCGPCKMLTPILEKVKEDVGDSAVISKVNVDENPQLASKFGVRSIPTILIFKNGEIKETLVGLKQQAELTSLLLD